MFRPNFLEALALARVVAENMDGVTLAQPPVHLGKELTPLRVGDSDRDVLVEERSAGQMIGWSGLIPPHRFTLKASAQAATDVIVLPRSRLEEFFAANPEIGYVVARNLASVIGRRLQVLQAMWLREMQRFVESRT